MARGKEHQGNLGSMAEAFQRMVHEEKARLDPDYSGDNPKTPREAKRDMEKLGIVKEPSKGKKRQARSQPQATSVVSDDWELTAGLELLKRMKERKGEKLSPFMQHQADILVESGVKPGSEDFQEAVVAIEKLPPKESSEP